MKNQRLTLDYEDDASIILGLVRLIKPVQDHELFFHINQINDLCFQRIDDFPIEKEYHSYSHSVFTAFHQGVQNCIQFISNKSIVHTKKKEIVELFTDEEDVNYLLPNFQDVDYIIKTSDNIDEFSVILLPENMMFQIQEYELTSEEEFYHLIQYYE